MTYPGRVLVVSDIEIERRALTEHLRGQGFTAVSSESPPPSVSEDVTVVVFAMSTQQSASQPTVASWCRRYPSARVVVLVDALAKDLGLAAVSEGAFDFLTRPINTAEAGFVVRRAWQDLQNARELLELRQQLNGNSRAFHDPSAGISPQPTGQHSPNEPHSPTVRSVLSSIQASVTGVPTPLDFPTPTPTDSSATHATTTPEPAASPAVHFPMGLALEQLERIAITRTLNQLHGNRTHAAQKLGISVRTLQRKIRQYELEGQPSPSRSDPEQFT